MSNLLQETIEILKQNNKSEEDVVWCGDETRYFSWEHFKSIANIEYDSGYGGTEVLEQIKVFGDDWWIERHEYDGSEWWEFKSLPKKPTECFEISSVLRDKLNENMDDDVYIWSEDTLEEIQLKLTPPTKP